MHRGSIKKWMASNLRLAAQLLSDKSAISFKAESFSFCLFHITLLNLSKEWRRKHINSGRNMCAYLPVSYVYSRTEADHGDELHMKGSKSMKTDRTKLLNSHHDELELSLKPIADTAFQGPYCTSSDRA